MDKSRLDKNTAARGQKRMFAKFVEFLLTFLTLQGITGLFEESTDTSVLQKINEMDQEIQSLKKKVSHLECKNSPTNIHIKGQAVLLTTFFSE